MTLKKLGLTRAFALSLCVAAVGCVASDEDRPSKDVVSTEVAPVGTDAVGTERVMARYRATYTAGKGLSFAPIAPTGPSVTPQGFRLDTGSLFTFATTPGTDGAGPNAVYADCGATQVCAQVAVQVATAVTGDTQGDVWVAATDLDPTGLTIANSDTPPGANSPLAQAFTGAGGKFNYGTLTDGVDAVKRWNFSLPAGFDPANDNFSFNVEVYASFHIRSDVGYSKVDLTGPLTPIDVCASGGVQRLTVNDDDQVSTTFALPWVTHLFRFSSYNSGTGANSNIWVSENGTFGIGPSSTSAVNQRLSLFPFGLTRGAVAVFWQDLVFADLDPADGSGAVGEVCSKVDGAFPSRTLTITWKNMEITNAGARTGNIITFSSILHESTDIVEFHYNQPTTLNAQGRGGLATIGIQASDPAGTTGASRQIAHKSATFLPATGAGYPFGTSLVPN